MAAWMTSMRGNGASATIGAIASDAINEARAIKIRRDGWRQLRIASTTQLRKKTVDRLASKRIEPTRSSQTHMETAPSQNFARSRQPRRLPVSGRPVRFQPQTQSSMLQALSVREARRRSDPPIPMGSRSAPASLVAPTPVTPSSLCAFGCNTSSLFSDEFFLQVRFEERLILGVVDHGAKSVQLIGSG